MSATNAEMLAAAKDALMVVLSGGKRSVSTPLGVQYTNLELSELRALIAELEGEVALEAVSGSECVGIQELGITRL